MAIVGDAHILIHAITDGFKDDIKRALDGLSADLNNAGRDMGKGFSDNFRRSSSGMFGKLGVEADAARLSLNRLTRAGYITAPAIAGLLSAIGDLIVGLGGMVAAIGRATPALAVLGGGFAALIQGAIAAKLAFGGIGAAVSALNKQAGGGADNSKAVEAAKKALDDLKKRSKELQDQYAKDLFKAQERVTEAQEALNEAYKAGAESLQQLRFEAEGAVYAEERAALGLERARETLIRAQDLPPNSRMRREAELAYKEAELNYRMAKDRASDLYQEVSEANAKGIEGTQEVVSAKEEEKDALAAVSDLMAEHAKRMDEINDDIVDANKRVKEAGVGAISAIGDAFKDLSPEAQRFARYIAGLKPVLLELRAAAGRNLFLPLENAIQNLVDNLVPVLIPMLEKTGGAIGDVAVAFSNMLTSPKNLEIFERVFGERNIKVIENIGGAFVNVADGILTILDAVSPLAVEFSKFINDKTASWAEGMASNTGGLAETFNDAAEAAKIIGKSLKGLWKGFKAFGEVAADMGLDLFESLGKSGEAMADFFTPKTKAEADAMDKKFKQVGENVKAIGSFFGEVLKFFFEIAGNPGVQKFFEQISVIPSMFTDSTKELTGLGETMGEFIVSLAKVMELLLESGGAEAFMSSLTAVLDVVAAFLSIPIVQEIFKILATIKGFTLALGTIGKVVQYTFGALILSPIKSFFGFFKKDAAGVSKFSNIMSKLKSVLSSVGQAFSKVGGFVKNAFVKAFQLASKAFSGFISVARTIGGILKTGIGAAVRFLSGAFTKLLSVGRLLFTGLQVGLNLLRIAAISHPILLLLTLLVGAFVLAYTKSETFRNIVNKALEGVKNAAMAVFNWVKQNWPLLLAILTGPIGLAVLAIVKNWDKIKKGFSLAMDKIKSIAGGIKDFIVDKWNAVVSFFKSLPGKIGSAASGMWDGIKNAFKSAINWIIDKWNNMQFRIPSITIFGQKIFDGYTLDTPNIPRLAEGGVVRPRRGGVTAVLAEAGRAERVEPLDANGLSERDKALIAELSGKSGGGSVINMTINPSPGMDEVALAKLVSRQLGFQLRKGTV